MRPYDLTTEQLRTPLGVDELRPRLSWKLLSDRRGAAQSACRITAATRESDLDDPGRLLWDTGRRESADGLLVSWDGPALHPGTRYHWRVEVWDETGAYAAAAQTWFETGLLHPAAWTAVWIGRDPVHLPPFLPPTDESLTVPSVSRSPLYLRTEFTLPGAPVRARLYATAHGIYEPRVNGVRAGDRQLAPGWTEYHRRLQYQTYDVTALLHTGPNALGVIVADGWWSGCVGFDALRPARHYGDVPAVLAQLAVDFDDGSQRVVVTGPDWTEHDGAIRAADLLMGEFVDARRDVAGWDAPGATGTFRPVAVLSTEPGPLVAEPDEPVRVTAERLCCIG